MFYRGDGVYQRASNLSGGEELLFKATLSRPKSWSFDGRFLLLDGLSDDPKKVQLDVFVLPMDGPTRKPIPIVSTEFNELDATFSPDGKWTSRTHPTPPATAKSTCDRSIRPHRKEDFDCGTASGLHRRGNQILVARQ